MEIKILEMKIEVYGDGDRILRLATDANLDITIFDPSVPSETRIMRIPDKIIQQQFGFDLAKEKQKLMIDQWQRTLDWLVARLQKESQDLLIAVNEFRSVDAQAHAEIIKFFAREIEYHIQKHAE